MAEIEPRTRRLHLEAGSPVVLHPDGPAGGPSLIMAVDRVDEGRHWFRGSIAPLREGESVLVESPVREDARYATRARIVTTSASRFALEIEQEWTRVQQREFVRVSTQGLPVRLVRVAEERVPSRAEVQRGEGDVYELLDISAGGIRFHCEDDFEADEEVVCHFELPDSLCLVLPARIVRQPEPLEGHASKPGVAVAFSGLDEHTRSQLLRWIYREQVRRHRLQVAGETRPEAPDEPRDAPGCRR